MAKAMIIGRLFGWIFLAAAAAVLVRDLFMWAESGSFAFVTLGELWFTIDNASLNLVQAVTQRYLLPELWDPVIVTVLLWPAVPVFAVIGAALLWVFRRRQR